MVFQNNLNQYITNISKSDRFRYNTNIIENFNSPWLCLTLLTVNVLHVGHALTPSLKDCPYARPCISVIRDLHGVRADRLEITTPPPPPTLPCHKSCSHIGASISFSPNISSPSYQHVQLKWFLSLHLQR